MNVKRSVLENKSDKELEAYIKQGNRFVPEANIYAYEILKARGREFSAEETERIQKLITEKSKPKVVIIHPNHKKASKLIYLSVALGIIYAVFNPEIFTFTFGIITAVFTIGLLTTMAYLASKGQYWVKYLLLIFIIFGLLGIKIIILNLVYNPIVGIINIAQLILQLYALILLFKVPKTSEH